MFLVFCTVLGIYLTVMKLDEVISINAHRANASLLSIYDLSKIHVKWLKTKPRMTFLLGSNNT